VVERLRGAFGQAGSGLLTRVLLAFLTIYLVWGSTFLAIRVAIESIPPLLMCGLRLLSAGALMVLWARARGDAWPRGREWRDAVAVGVLLPAIGNGAVTLGETHVASGLVALLVASIPLWMALLTWLGPRGVRPAPLALLGLALGFAGVGLLLGPGALEAGHGTVSPLWALIPVGGSLSWAWGSLFSRRAQLPRSPHMGTGVGLVAGGVLLLVASALAGEPARLDPALVRTSSLLSLAYLSILGTVVTFSAYLFLLRTVSPTIVSTYAFVNPIVAMGLGWMFAGERLTTRTLAAAALVIASVVLITVSRLRAAPAATAPAERPRGRSAA